ncbi:DNA repair protein RadC [Cronobacter sakazakii]|uniref:JAB domain-containing protein n=1 Tax=Cronobacter sakazakii TaxID=28141 RepID=UPI0009B9D420|nr:DNA repair protein RadC [Cronobacter sakazakii]MCZ6132211.1 DNA repair protein RadC [Cronobacter sakazakii]MCZ6139870.1 DNA repair protein RadC [Cronobacter sakazakii]PUX81434.1 DNA repair protein RadC [Cronobacter sakazakii]
MNYEDSIINLAMGILQSRLKQTSYSFTSPDAVKQYLRLHLQNQEREFFGALFLDNQNQLISFEMIHSGTINSVQISPREVAKLALKLNAQAVIFAHNHPSGSPQPSRADIDVTAKLKTALALFEISTLDHFIVAGNEVVSMAERGHI